jgi:hypothetical protein
MSPDDTINLTPQAREALKRRNGLRVVKPGERPRPRWRKVAPEKLDILGAEAGLQIRSHADGTVSLHLELDEHEITVVVRGEQLVRTVRHMVTRPHEALKLTYAVPDARWVRRARVEPSWSDLDIAEFSVPHVLNVTMHGAELVRPVTYNDAVFWGWGS